MKRTPPNRPPRGKPKAVSAGLRTPKEHAQTLLREMPEDSTFEEIQNRLYAIAKAERGFRSIDEGKGIPHDEVKRRLSRWLSR